MTYIQVNTIYKSYHKLHLRFRRRRRLTLSANTRHFSQKRPHPVKKYHFGYEKDFFVDDI